MNKENANFGVGSNGVSLSSKIMGEFFDHREVCLGCQTTLKDHGNTS